MSRIFKLSVFWIAAALALGCNDDGRACYPGDLERCECADGVEGYRKCEEDGSQYGVCECGAGTGGSTGGGGSSTGSGGKGGSGGAEPLPFMSPCEKNEECETGLCHNYPSKGPHCSHSCKSGEDCEPPSTGCNMMGICKAP